MRPILRERLAGGGLCREPAVLLGRKRGRGALLGRARDECARLRVPDLPWVCRAMAGVGPYQSDVLDADAAFVVAELEVPILIKGEAKAGRDQRERKLVVRRWGREGCGYVDGAGIEHREAGGDFVLDLSGHLDFGEGTSEGLADGPLDEFVLGVDVVTPFSRAGVSAPAPADWWCFGAMVRAGSDSNWARGARHLRAVMGK